jgi:hypothetical protein
MAAPITISAESNQESYGSAALTLRRAWVVWFALLGSPFVMFLVTVWVLNDQEPSVDRSGFARAWFLASMAFLAVVIPGAFFWRSRIFKAYWSGQVVAPRDYFRGMLTIWVALETCSFVGLLGCLISGRALPCLLPALVAFILYVPLWPSGRAMTRPVGNEDDAEVYEDPR